jgi:hypothetical protein
MKSKKRAILPKLNKANYSKKKYKYKLSYNSKRRRLALDSGIKSESKKKGLKKAAIAKKGRLNILRIYRRYKNPKQCRIITNDMKYIDKKYKLGNTKNICKKTKCIIHYS